MPLSGQFSLSLELANILPIRSALSYAANSLIGLVRDLKRSGSDFLVEEDLAAIFGRGRIVSSFEANFRDVVKVVSFVPLHPESEIILDASPGATVRRALKDNYYMATVIQLSFLGWMHETTSLASVLVETMNRRFELGVQDATPDPDYDGILATLRSCLSQTSQYPWQILVQIAETKFEKSRSWLNLQNSPLKRLSPDTLLAAMDYLFLVQSLPEDRLMMIDNQMGVIPIIIWAHYILGLRVLVQNSPDGDVFLGAPGNPQIIIKWSNSWQRYEAELISPPSIYLLDGGMNIVLTTSTEENEAVKLEGEERLRLAGYGTTFLRRTFQRTSIVADNHVIYSETAQFAIAFAVAIARVLRRVPFQDRQDPIVPAECYGNTEIWQIKDSSHVLFEGIQLDWSMIEDYVGSIGTKSGSWRIPPAIRSYLENREPEITRDLYKKGNLIEDVKRLASWILAFAHVVDVKSCAELPLIWDPEWNFCPGIMLWDGQKPIDMPSNMWFSRIIHMLVGQNSGKISVGSGSRLFLISERGWSLFHSNLGDNDPSTVNCESLSIKRGVPTNTRTKERRYQISDAPRIQPPALLKGLALAPRIVEKAGLYTPRCFTRVTKRTEHYTSRSNDFWLAIRYDVEETWPEGVKTYSIYASPRQFHEALWGVVKTTNCTHFSEVVESVELDLGVVTVKGFAWTDETFTRNHRICVCLVKGDSRARWLAISGIIQDTDEAENVRHGLSRQIMLRSEKCCVRCAVQSASVKDGDWLVIL